jgi:lysophospholipase L1-like esterase
LLPHFPILSVTTDITRLVSHPVVDEASDMSQHPWTRYVAIGDSFTEGVGDPEPSNPGGYRGWADRVAEVLAETADDFAYANLAIRGRLLNQISDEQAQAALELKPDLISVSAGGNDLIRPGADPDEVSVRVESLVQRLRSEDATVVLFTGPDIGATPVLRRVRGKVAIYNENIRAIAQKHDAIIADMWALAALGDPRMWAPDRLHFSAIGHNTIAAMVLYSLNVDNTLEPFNPEPLAHASWRQARADDVGWARDHLMPWVLRRIRHESSGDNIAAKRPTF